MKPGLSIIIPVLNEESIIRENTQYLLGHLTGLGRDFEIIIVSNGSKDRTEEYGRLLDHEYETVRFFSLPHKGVGHAFVLGVQQARYPAVISLDMDLSIDLDLIPRALDLLEEYHIVVGSKKMGSQKRTYWRKVGSGAYILIARLLLGLSFEDYSIAAKAYRRETILKYLNLIDHGTSYVLDIIFYTLNDGGTAVEVPVHCEDFRASRFNLIREALYRFHNLFRLWWNSHYRSRPIKG